MAMAAVLGKISVIIPISRDEHSWTELLKELVSLPLHEIILVCARLTPELTKTTAQWPQVKCIESEEGRAKQLNEGAFKASGKFLWFLHADSRLTPRTVESLERALKKRPEAVIFFDLDFLDDGPKTMAVNKWGVWLRSHVLGLPFGDQGLCVSSEGFKRLGGFPTGVSYGEDHLFVWKARQQRVPLYCTGEKLKTSARKYAQNGWLKTTILHLILTYKQAIPEYESGSRVY